MKNNSVPYDEIFEWLVEVEGCSPQLASTLVYSSEVYKKFLKFCEEFD